MNVTSQQVKQTLRIGERNFQQLLGRIDDKKTYEKALREANKKYEIKNFKVTNMTPVKAKKIYPFLMEKYAQNLAQEQSWLQNERRLFLWLVLCYVFVSHKSITALTFQELSYFSSIFNNKKQDFLKFQIYALLKKQKNSIKWAKQQDQILMDVLKSEKYTNQEQDWNQVSKHFFQESGHKFYRSSKQCRQRWMNHLDPNKVKGNWTSQQDLALLKFVKEKGKKWSQIVKEMNGCKTQHMVKNRFNSLVNKKSKQTKSRNQDKLINRLIEEIQANEVKNLDDYFKTSSRENQSWKSNRSDQIKSEKNQEMPNIFQPDNSNSNNGRLCKFFVQRAGSLSLSERGGMLPQLANPILEEMDSQEQRANNKLLGSTPFSERGNQLKSPFLISSPLITGNGGNITPSLFFLEQNQKGNNPFFASDFSMSFSSNFDKFVPEKQ